MRVLVQWCALALICACGEVKSPKSDAATDSASGADVNTSDASTARCDPGKPFGTPVLLANVNSSNEESMLSLSGDEGIAFIGRGVETTGSSTLLLAQRASPDLDFPAPTSTLTAALNNETGNEYAPSPVADALILYFHRQTANGIAIYAATRADSTAAFSAGSMVSVDGTGLQNALSPTISADGQTLYWLDFNDFKLRAATRGSTPTSFTNARTVSTMSMSGPAVLSRDELTLYYAAEAGIDVLESTRANTSAMFGTGVPLANVNSAMNDGPVALTGDGCVLYIVSTRSGGVGGEDIWQARRPK